MSDNLPIISFKNFWKVMQHEHSLVSIFEKYDPENPRILRISVQFIKFIVVLAGIMSFSGNNMLLAFVVSFFLNIIVKILVTLISPFLKSSNRIVRIAGGVILLCMISVATFIILTLLALSSSQQD